MGKNIVERIKAFIKEHKLSKRMFADMCGINYTTLLCGMQGKSRFRGDIEKKIEKVLKSNGPVVAGRYSKCNPPQSCFNCPLPDCNNNKIAAKAETVYLQAGTAKDYIESDSNSRQYDTTLNFCRKYNLLM